MAQRGDTVTVKPFFLDTTEVTADAYARCVRAGSCSVTGVRCTAEATFGGHDRGDHPMNCVDWGQAATYCRSRDKRLPTEEEWEWASRGAGAGSRYPWGNGDVIPEEHICWSGDSKRDGTCAVGLFPQSDAPGGIHDLAGNVWEWTSTLYEHGPARVFRGGSWSDIQSDYVSASYRNASYPGYRVAILGFRCAR
jgi:formylglycine-generating enzyme required for sulfatase activity